MVEVSDIKWGTYTSNDGTKYEGPYFHGNWKFELSPDSSLNERIVWAITSTEGGAYDAVNMYDSCVMTVGIVQWCDRFHLVTKMLGNIADRCGVAAVTTPLAPAMTASGAMFKKNKNGQWRFFQRGVECQSTEQLRALYYAGSSGKKGQWLESQKFVAKVWAAGMANIWNDPVAREVQLEYTAARLSTFTLKDSKKIILDSNDSWNGIIGATKAIYLSYSANNPGTADVLVKVAVGELKVPEWSIEWCMGIIKKLALGSNIKIWPGRYDKVSVAANELFGTNLPTTHEELAEWEPPKPEPIHELEPEVIPILPDVEPDYEPPVVPSVPEPEPESERVDTLPSVEKPPEPIVKYREGWSIIDFIVMIITKIIEAFRRSRGG